MKRILLAASVLFAFGSMAQIINDHKISFNYIQLPQFKIDENFNTYDVQVVHNYTQANADSLAMFEIRREAELSVFNQMMTNYRAQCDSLDRMHLRNLAAWEKQVNAGVKNPDGTPLAKPTAPYYPSAPEYPQTEQPQQHSPYSDDAVNSAVSLDGFNKGVGGVVITITIEPIRNIRIVQSKKGSASSTKYEYNAQYILPIGVKVETPTQGVLMETTWFEGVKSYKMKTHKSQYDHELYMMDNEQQFFMELENHARRTALASAKIELANKFGFVQKTRTAEIYSVKSFKNYDYSDVTNAFSKTTLALNAVGADRDRSGAMDKLEAAIVAVKSILEESAPHDKKARINDKITAMLQCNLAELYVWQAEFNQCIATLNLAKNSGVGKAKRHCRDEEGFYADQRERWNVNF